MPTPNSPPGDSSPSGNGEPPYEWLDEWLCEYVDGAMDPSLETVFEQYVEANPELKAHVERLCETRKLLTNAAPSDPPHPPAPEPDADAPPPDAPPTDPVVSARISPFATLLSVTVALMVGFLAGTLFEESGPTRSPSSPPPAAARSSEAPASLSPAPGALDLLRTSRQADAQRPASPSPDSMRPPVRTP
jgi:anti-sigma factor RsiW